MGSLSGSQIDPVFGYHIVGFGNSQGYGWSLGIGQLELGSDRSFCMVGCHLMLLVTNHGLVGHEGKWDENFYFAGNMGQQKVGSLT